MLWLWGILGVAWLGTLAWALFLHRQVKKLVAQAGQLRAADQSIDELLGSPAVDPISDPRTLICIEILNPLELAAKESWFADKFGSVSPSLIKKLVHDQALKMTHQHLAAHGAHAEVHLHRA